jgi:hypothetical protein
MSTHRHVMPDNDIVEHQATDTCVCGPTAELVKHDDSTDAGWLHVHHSLDGREMAEHH